MGELLPLSDRPGEVFISKSGYILPADKVGYPAYNKLEVELVDWKELNLSKFERHIIGGGEVDDGKSLDIPLFIEVDEIDGEKLPESREERIRIVAEQRRNKGRIIAVIPSLDLTQQLILRKKGYLPFLELSDLIDGHVPMEVKVGIHHTAEKRDITDPLLLGGIAKSRVGDIEVDAISAVHEGRILLRPKPKEVIVFTAHPRVLESAV